MAKKYYFQIKDPKGKIKHVLAETKFEAIAEAIERDGGRYFFKEYIAKKLK